jgi:gamma-glutamyltranspeptidase / glutathione hydrolase
MGGRSTVCGTAGVVATEDPRASLAAVRALDAGGNAVDACVAAAGVMAVVAPMMTGPGGDAFLLDFDAATGQVRGLEGAGAAGRGASIEAVRALGHERMPARGPEGITVPGAVRLWEDATTALGRLPLAELLAPARELAERGFPAGEVVSRMWREAEPVLEADPASAEAFLPAPHPGELVTLPDLARTLGVIAEDGADAFYEGEIAERIVETAAFLTPEDLAGHRSTWVEPLTAGYHGLLVHEMPPPTIGIAALAMLRMLEPENLGALDPLSAERIHLEATAKQAAFAELPVDAADPARRGEGDTTLICVVDRDGNGCTLINSLYKSFGSGLVAPGTGVCLHGRGFGFTLEPGHPGAIAPGRRPLHTLMPGLVTKDGALWAAYGNMGGFMQPQGHVQVLVNLHDHGMTPQAAVDHPRHFHDHGVLLVEGRVPEAELEKLRAWGHNVEEGPAYAILTGGAQVVRVLEDGVRAAGSDPRKDGCALAE